MLCGIIGFIIGNLSGVMLLCLLQISKDRNGGVEYAIGNEETESEKEERTIEALLSELSEERGEEIR